jgi:hypothetical protein
LKRRYGVLLLQKSTNEVIAENISSSFPDRKHLGIS